MLAEWIKYCSSSGNRSNWKEGYFTYVPFHICKTQLQMRKSKVEKWMEISAIKGGGGGGGGGGWPALNCKCY